MIVLLAVASGCSSARQLIDAARRQADRGLAGSMEGHAAMDMSITASGSFCPPPAQPGGLHLGQPHLRDGVGGGAPGHRHRPADRRRGRRLGARTRFWQHLFLTGHPLGAQALGAADRPGHRGAQLRLLDRQRAAGRRCCGTAGSASAAWSSFIFADLIIIPILIIYRKYYGTRMMLVLLGHRSTSPWCWPATSSSSSSAGSAWSRRTDAPRSGRPGIAWNYTTVPQHRLPAPRRRAAGALLPVRGPFHAQDDGWPPGRGTSHAHPAHAHGVPDRPLIPADCRTYRRGGAGRTPGRPGDLRHPGSHS